MRDPFEEGIRLFNSGKFFECHEALEALWLEAEGAEKTFLHGLIQIAVAFHHYSRGNEAGFRSVFQKGRDKLVKFRRNRRGIDLPSLHRQLQAWQDYLDGAGRKTLASVTPIPPLPHIRFESRRS